MKICYFSFLYLVVSLSIAQAQTLYKGLRLGATAGMSFNNFNSNFGSTTLDGNIPSFTLGAGASYLRNRLIVGGEFYQLNGSKINTTESMQFIGSVTTVSIGYCFAQIRNTRVETSLGFGFSNNQIISQDKSNTRFENVYNNQLILNPSIGIYQKSANNLCFGLKFVYSIGTAGDSAWKYQSGDLTSPFIGNVNAFSLQVTVGGIIEFLKK